MAKKPEVCSCGAPYDSSGVCTACGKKRPRGAGYRVFHGILCVIAALILLLCMTTTAFVRWQLKNSSMTKALREETKLSEATAPFGSKTLAQRIHEDNVTDEAVTESDVAEAIDCMELPDFVADKLTVWGDMLRGTSDTVMQISADEVIALLEEHEGQIYRACMLVIDASDKQELRSELEGPLNALNKSFTTVYGSPALRALAKFRVSIWHYVLDAVLLVLLLWRWASVQKKGGRRALSAFRKMGVTAMVPSVIALLCCAVFGIAALFAKDGVVGVNPLLKAARAPYWFTSMLGIAGGALLIIIDNVGQQIEFKIAAKKEAKAAEQSRPQPVMESVAAVSADPTPAPVAPITPAAPAAPAAPASEKFCVHCGKAIPAKAGFCIHCGKSQAAVPAPPAPPEPPVLPDDPAADPAFDLGTDFGTDINSDPDYIPGPAPDSVSGSDPDPDA